MMNKFTFLINGIDGKNSQSISEKLLTTPGAKPLRPDAATGIYIFVAITGSGEDAITESVASAISGTGAFIMSCRVESF